MPSAMAEVFAACHAVLRPGGRLVVVTKNTRRKGRMLDLAGLTVALATRAGFSYLGHVIALHAADPRRRPVPRALLLAGHPAPPRPPAAANPLTSSPTKTSPRSFAFPTPSEAAHAR